MHDWSKFSPEEFWESVKYYNGKKSPIIVCKQKNGYSKAWLHHKGRNKHHPEYWVDWALPQKAIIMPYKYAVEMICDKMAAGIVYNGKDWKQDTQIKYYMKERETSIVHLNCGCVNDGNIGIKVYIRVYTLYLVLIDDTHNCFLNCGCIGNIDFAVTVCITVICLFG